MEDSTPTSADHAADTADRDESVTAPSAVEWRAILSDASEHADDVFRALAGQRRRLVLHRLRQADDCTVSVDELVEFVMEWEANADETDGPAPTEHDVEVTLHHRDLPLLADVGLVEHDARAGTARYVEDPIVEVTLPAEADE